MQAEPRAALSLAARGESPLLKLSASDLVLYSAKVSPAAPCCAYLLCNFEGFTAKPCESRSILAVKPARRQAVLGMHTWPDITTGLFARAPQD